MAKSPPVVEEEVVEEETPQTEITEAEYDDDGKITRYPIAEHGFATISEPVYLGVDTTPKDHETLDELLKEKNPEYYTDEVIGTMGLNDKMGAVRELPETGEYAVPEEEEDSGYVLNPIEVEVENDEGETETVVKPFLDENENPVTNPVASDEEVEEREENTEVSEEPTPDVGNPAPPEAEVEEEPVDEEPTEAELEEVAAEEDLP